MNLIIGSHVSFDKENQLLKSLNEALSYDATTFMFYTGAPQNTVRANIDNEITKKALDKMKENNIDINNVVVHAPYIINLANINNYDFNVRFLKEEILRTISLGVKLLVLHPGSHVGIGIDAAIKNIVDSLNEVLNEDMNIKICIETMAGKGTEVGSNFNEIKAIIEGVKLKDKIAVCLDTCHINDAGYDLNDFDKILDDFDKIVGLKYLKVLHINDSKNIMGAKKDRHENIGYGTIGFDNLVKVIYNEKLKDVPKILETPYVEYNGKKLPPYKFEIEMIRNKKFNDRLIETIGNFYN